MNNFWRKIYHNFHQDVDIELGVSDEDIVEFILETFSQPDKKDTQDFIIKELFKAEPLIQIQALKDENAQAHIFRYLNQRSLFSYKTLDKQRTIPFLEVLLQAKSNHDVMKIYFDSMKIRYSLSGNKTFFISDLLDGTHDEAFKHLLPIWSLRMIENIEEFRQLSLETIEKLISHVISIVSVSKFL